MVLQVRTLAGAGGGPDSAILGSGDALRAGGYATAAAYMCRRGDPGYASCRRRAEACGYPLIAIDDRGPLDAMVLYRLWALCERLDVAIWHGHDYKSNVVGLLLRRLHPMALVSTVHGWVTHTARTPLYYAIDRWCLRRYDHVLSVSAELDAAVGALGVPAGRRRMVGNGVDSERFRRGAIDRDRWRVRHGIAAQRCVIAAVGRLSDEKRFEDLIDASGVLMGEGHDIQLCIAGEGPRRAALQARSDRLGLRDRVLLLGLLDDPTELYGAADVFALSSVREGMPTVLLEAMAMSLPVVASRVGGVPSAIHDGEDGLLYRCTDVAALVDALRRLIGDAALRTRLGSAARRTVEERFTLAARVRAEVAVYDALLAG